MEPADAPVDMERLARPEVDAFRYIAEVLGARFAGDSAPAPVVRPAARAPARPNAGFGPGVGDHRGAALLDRMPVAALVVDGDSIAFANRAALGLLGYSSAAVLDAVGGLAALFSRGVPHRPGALAVETATGAIIRARVTMTSVEWGGGRAILVVIQPQDTGGARDGPSPGDPLVQLLDANPDPVAVVTRSGVVEACNRAFARLPGAPERTPPRLEDRLGPADLRRVIDTVALCFCMENGVAELRVPVDLGGVPHLASAGALPAADLACVIFHRAGAARDGAPADLSPARPGLTALERAVEDVRRLVHEASVLVVVEGLPKPPADGDREEALVRLLRAVVLAVAARAPVGSVIAVREEGAAVTLTLSPAVPEALERAVTSPRLQDLAAAAGHALVLGDGMARIEAADPSCA